MSYSHRVDFRKMNGQLNIVCNDIDFGPCSFDAVLNYAVNWKVRVYIEGTSSAEMRVI